jgi:hypothetical protein
MVEVEGKPPKKAFHDTQFSSVKRRSGRESVPFLGLEPGEHTVIFKHGKGSTECRIKVWLSMYGWAWKIIKQVTQNERA